MDVRENTTTLSPENITGHLTDYVETHLKLGVVNAAQKAADVATVTLTVALVSSFCMFILLFAGLGFSIWLGDLWHNNKAGYFAVSGFYSVAVLLFIAINKNYISPLVRDYIIRKAYA